MAFTARHQCRACRLALEWSAQALAGVGTAGAGAAVQQPCAAGRIGAHAWLRASGQTAGFVQSSPSALVQQYAALVTLAEPVSVPRVVTDDPDDDAVVAAALAANVDCIVSGDKHLLRLNGKIAVPVLKAAGVIATSAV